MEPHCLRVFWALNLMMLMTTHAALPPEIYWKMMLPSTPMPKAVIELLRGDVSIETCVDTYTQSKDKISKEISSQDNPLWIQYTKEAQSNDQLPISNLGVKEIQSQDNPLWIQYTKESQSKDQLPISNLGVKEIQSHDNPLWIQYTKESQSNDQLPISNLGAKEIQSQDIPLWIQYTKKSQSKDQLSISNLGVKEIQSQDNPLWIQYTKESQSNDQLPISNLGVKEIQSQDNPLWIQYTKESQSNDQHPISNLGVKEIQSQDNPLWIQYTKESQSDDRHPISNLGVKEIQSQDNPLWIQYTKESQSKDQLPVSNLGVKKISSQDNPLRIYVGKESQLENSGASDHHLHEISARVGFFQEDQLHSDNKFYMHLNKIRSSIPLLPRQITQQIPFSLDKMKEVLEMLSVKPNSKNAEIMEKTISGCEAPAMDGEEKYCATSLESMMDFVTSKLGKNVHAMSTDVQKETKLQNLLVKDGVKKLADDHVIACHPLAYPYVVFGCHELQKTSAYFVPLEGEDGVRVKAVAVCHKDTSKWDPNYVAFRVLKVKPGTVPVCHFFPEGHLLWLSK